MAVGHGRGSLCLPHDYSTPALIAKGGSGRFRASHSRSVPAPAEVCRATSEKRNEKWHFPLDKSAVPGYNSTCRCGRLAQLVRALRSHRRGLGFESPIFHQTEMPAVSRRAFLFGGTRLGDENSPFLFLCPERLFACRAFFLPPPGIRLVRRPTPRLSAPRPTAETPLLFRGCFSGRRCSTALPVPDRPGGSICGGFRRCADPWTTWKWW